MRNTSWLTLLVLAVALPATSSHAATIAFSNVQSTLVASATGQDFPYSLSPGTPTGVVNVKLVAGEFSSIVAGGGGSDPHGLYVLQNAGMQPVRIRFTFDQPVGFLIQSNETLTGLETNTFSYPSLGKPWSVMSSINATATTSATTVSIVGQRNSPPYGDFQVQGASTAFDFEVTNASGFPYYGSAISVTVLGYATPIRSLSWSQAKRLLGK